MIESIIKTVCSELEINPDCLILKTRKREVVQARQVCHYFAKQYTELSLEKIGEKVGKKDHATVMHSIKTVGDIMFSDRGFKRIMDGIDFKLQVLNEISKKKAVKRPVKSLSISMKLREISGYGNSVNMRIALNELRHFINSSKEVNA